MSGMCKRKYICWCIVIIASLFLSFVYIRGKNGEIIKIDDSYMHLFSEECQLDSTTGFFTGFPKVVIHDGFLYVLYTYHSQHQSIPRVEQDYLYYKFSKDGGKTWSERKRLKMPRSTIPGISYDYRGLELVDNGNRIIGIGIIAPSDTNGILFYRPYYCELIKKKNGELKYNHFKMMPYVSEEGKKIELPAHPGDRKKGSNIVAGNMLLIDGQLYWCYYNSVRNVQLLKWNTQSGRIPDVETIEVLANFGDNNKTFRYSEAGMFYENGYIYMSIRDEKAKNSNWSYNLRTKEIFHIGNTATRAFGPNIFKPSRGPILLTGRQYTYLKWRNQLTRMDNIILLSTTGEIIKENIGFVGHLMGSDSMYCSTVELDGKVFIFYYYGMNNSQISPDSRYTLAYKTIKVEDLPKLIE